MRRTTHNSFQLSATPCLGPRILVLLLLISTKIAHSAGEASWRELKPDPPIVQSHTSSRQRKLEFPTISEEGSIEKCTASLEDSAVAGKVGRAEYLTFLDDFSSSSLTFEAFADLPLPLVLVFYTAACSSGRDCINQQPSVSLEHIGANPGLLSVLCSSIEEMAVLQIEFPFQYQIQYRGNGLGAEDFWLDGGIDGIRVRDLEDTTQKALMERLSCVSNSDAKHRQVEESSNSKMPITKDRATDAMKRGFKYSIETSQFQFSQEEEDVRRRTMMENQSNGNSPCNYKVRAQVVDIFEFECVAIGAPVGPDLQCALVSSKVVVTAASLTFRPTPEELREDIASTLRSVFTNNRILDYLDI